MDEPVRIECPPQCTDPAIHHVRWGNDIHARARLGQRLLLEDRDGLVIEDIPCSVDDTVLAMAGVRIERDVGHHPQLWKTAFQGSDGPRDKTVRIACLPAIRSLQPRFDRGKNGDDRYAPLE